MKASIKSVLSISLLFACFLLYAQEAVDTAFVGPPYVEREFTFRDTVEEEQSFLNELVNEIVDVKPYREVLVWDTSNIADIRESYVARTFDTSRLAVYKEMDKFDFSEPKKTDSIFSQFFARLAEKMFGNLDMGIRSKFLRYLIILLATVLIVWFILRNELKSFVSKRDTKALTPKVGDLDISVSRDILLENLQKAELEGKYREAVRYSYLITLKKLNEENVIIWKDYKLGQDYVEEIEVASIKQDFQSITDYFNYAWYGNYQVDDTFYDKVRNYSERIQKEIVT